MAILKTLTINGTVYTLTPTVPTASVTLIASAWTGSDHHYSQVVNIPGVTPYTKVDLLPTAEQLAEFHTKSVGFVAENEDGRVTVCAIGDKPTSNYTIPVTLTEVTV
jgi:hypothetical protein